MQKISFNNKSNPFFKSLKSKVDQYFITQNLDPRGNISLYFKGAFQICTAIGLYVSLVFLHPDIFLSVILCVLLGVNLAFLGFNIMHEGAHQSFSKVKWINKMSAYVLNVLGGNALFWNIKHNLNHHTYTNIGGMDDDIEMEPFMRLHAAQRRYWIHRFQHIYWVFLYSISYFAWVFVNDFVKYFSGKLATGHENQKLSFKEHLIFWFTKIAYVTVFVLLPAYFTSLISALIGFGIMTAATGLTLGIVFQMAHVVEDTSFPKPNVDTSKIEQEWAIHQVETTANFGTRNKLLSWALGGLNFQVEHHLFPKISHIHYPAINALVKETCHEFNIKYVEYSSLGAAFWSHLKHIKRLGVA
ncbi:MAG TPA: acyl-CoA desaturase [Cytophagales bacterium]|nr:acyl-CoA desaturase [Cytophagales bacterium]